MEHSSDLDMTVKYADPHLSTIRFIIKNEGIDELSIQCEMTILCLQYLGFGCFGKNTLEMQLMEDIKAGYLSFQDYAVSRWFHHLQTMIERCGDFLSSEAAVAVEISRTLYCALDDFPFLDDIRLDEEADRKWLQQARHDCRLFKDPDLRDYLTEIWAHVCKHQQSPDPKKLDKVGIPALAVALDRNRKLMEEIGVEKGSRIQAQLEEYYGRNHYKCERVTCPYFHEGFEAAKDRDRHMRRHDRPFQCVIETCDQSIFGFSSNAQLEKHMRSYHPETCDLATLPAQFASLSKRKVEGTKFKCPKCEKYFTRKVNLNGHIDSHNGNKPFECPECGKGFARKNDMVRHQKIHSRYSGA